MKKVLLLCLLASLGAAVFAQDFGFGFGFEDDHSGGGSSGGVGAAFSLALSGKIGGEIAVEMAPYLYDFKKDTGRAGISFWDMVSGKLTFFIGGSYIEAYTAVNLNARAISELWEASGRLSELNYTPLIIDEAYVRAFMGPVQLVAGMRKLSWGKADSLGPLDVTNPLDYTDLRNISNIQAIKIARPMVHLTWNTGNFSKLEGVFIPNFAGHRFASEGRWMPAQYANTIESAGAGILTRAVERFPSIAGLIQSMYPVMSAGMTDFPVEFPNTTGLDYFQAGLRFTATIGPADIGGQYFYGNYFLPSFTVAGVDAFLDGIMGINPPFTVDFDFQKFIPLISPQIQYSRYHQIGIDYAQVLFSFNLRAEFALHLTNDLSGDDGSVRNPFIGWSLGFDRDLFWGINLNIQCNETIRLLNRKVGDNPILDAEADTDATSTRLTMQLSKKFLRDNLESKVAVIWDIENSDCYIIPALVWTMGELSSELCAGIFAGKESGELGSYWENRFIRLSLKYSF